MSWLASSYQDWLENLTMVSQPSWQGQQDLPATVFFPCEIQFHHLQPYTSRFAVAVAATLARPSQGQEEASGRLPHQAVNLFISVVTTH